MSDDERRFEIMDHNVAAGYVTYIVDLWDGDRTDPAVGVTRYIGVWREEQLENEEVGAFDPDFTQERMRQSYYTTRIEPKPLVWEVVEAVQNAHGDAANFKAEVSNLLRPAGVYTYGNRKKELYQSFMDAIDRLAEDENDAEAWSAVEAYRQYQALQHER